MGSVWLYSASSRLIFIKYIQSIHKIFDIAIGKVIIVIKLLNIHHGTKFRSNREISCYIRECEMKAMFILKHSDIGQHDFLNFIVKGADLILLWKISVPVSHYLLWTSRDQ